MFAIMIVIFHISKEETNGRNLFFIYGAIGVEFFFLTSGYLMAKKAIQNKMNTNNLGRETLEYIVNKIKVFFPYIIVAFIISILVNNWKNGYNKSQIINSIWNLFLMQMTGIRRTGIQGEVWYISAMLISMMILYPLIRKYKKNFIYLVSPLIVIFIGGWISYTYGNLVGVLVWTGLTYKGLLRAFFELALGTILYETTEKIKNVNFTKLGKVILTLIEIIGFISIFIITNIKNASNKYDCIMLLILAISITIAFSEKTLFLNFANNRFFYYLERLSLPIYLNHVWIIIIVNKIFKNLSYMKKMGIILISTLIFSVVIMYLIEKIKGKPTKIAKKLFIEK